MNILQIFAQLHANRAVFESLLEGTSADLQGWRLRPDHWCLLEIVCHLYDEEREDFRARLGGVLDDPTKPLPATDPQAWVAGRKYMAQDFDRTLSAFLKERDASIDWLKNLSNPQWENAFEHPTHGPLTATMFLANWLAHDYLHIRQINKVKYFYLTKTTDECFLYAGEW